MFESVLFNQVDFGYEKNPVLKGVSFTIRPNEFIHIIGPNGGGKTTLLKLMMGFLSPSKGTIQIFGKSPHKASGQIAYVPQTFAFDRLFPISVLQVVLTSQISTLPWHGFYPKKAKQRALKALEEVGLLEFKDHSIGELSGGQLQRVLIARALASDPKILILDEPTSCIDAQTQLEIEKLLLDLKTKMTVIRVTHDLEQMGKNADRVFCVHGTLTQIDPSEVCKHFSKGLYQHTHPSHPKKVLFS